MDETTGKKYRSVGKIGRYWVFRDLEIFVKVECESNCE